MRYTSFCGQTKARPTGAAAAVTDGTAPAAAPAVEGSVREVLEKLNGLGGRRAWFDDLADDQGVSEGSAVG